MTYLPIGCVKRWEKVAASKGVSKVARSRRGFLTAYKKAGGNPKKLPSSGVASATRSSSVIWRR